MLVSLLHSCKDRNHKTQANCSKDSRSKVAKSGTLDRKINYVNDNKNEVDTYSHCQTTSYTVKITLE